MKKYIFILLLFLQSTKAIACCSENDYRLYPIGEIDNEIVFIEFNLYRNCRNGTGYGDDNEFWIITGTVSLKKTHNDTLLLIETLDTIRAKECICTYKNYYEKTTIENLIEKYYLQALFKLKENKNFKVAVPKQIIFNDTSNTKITRIITDSTFSYIVEYKDLLKIDESKMDIVSCYPDIVAEVKTYETENFEIIIIRLKCYLISDIEKNNIIKRFKKIETAFWKEQPQWHGIAKDYYIIKNKH